MPDIFLSYSRTDLAVAGQLAAALQAAGHDVWWDQALKAGEVYDRVTETALREARAVVVLWSKASVQSDWVRSEATVALQRGALVPVMIEDCQRPVMFELRQSADLIGWKGSAKDPRLLALLADVARQFGAPAASATVAPAATGPNRRLLIGGAAGVAALAAGGFGVWKTLGGKPAAASTSIAVLPFANLSGDPAQAYLADGIAEELRTALASIAGLKVAARTSSELMRSADIKEAAAKLGVGHVLTGTVRRAGGTIRVTAQLLDGVTGLESWSQAYNRREDDLLTVQTGIAEQVANALSLQFGKAAAMVGGTRNPVAYEAYLRATANQLATPDAYAAALTDIDTAIAADPRFAFAHAFRSLLLVNMMTDVVRIPERLDGAIVAAQRALALAPGLRLPHATMGRARQFRYDFPAAEASFAAAARRPASTGRGIILEAIYASEMGRPAKAMALADLAVSLDPLNQVMVRNRVRVMLDGRKTAAALAEIDAWNGANPANRINPAYRARALMQSVRPAEALAEVDSGNGITARRHFWRAIAFAAMGKRAESDEALAAAVNNPGSPVNNDRGPTAQNVSTALVRAVQGEADLAFAALDRAYAEREVNLSGLRVMEELDPLRTDPRFKALEGRIGFPPR